MPAKRYRFTGMERDDETGLGYHGARYYAPWLGRWTAADPIGISGGINLFEYCSGNPVRFKDATGTIPFSPGTVELARRAQEEQAAEQSAENAAAAKAKEQRAREQIEKSVTPSPAFSKEALAEKERQRQSAAALEQSHGTVESKKGPGLGIAGSETPGATVPIAVAGIAVGGGTAATGEASLGLQARGTLTGLEIAEAIEGGVAGEKGLEIVVAGALAAEEAYSISQGEPVGLSPVPGPGYRAIQEGFEDVASGGSPAARRAARDAAGLIEDIGSIDPGAAPQVRGGADLGSLSTTEIERIQATADKSGKTVVLFGSRARGTADELSDYDFIVEGLNSRFKKAAHRAGLPRNRVGVDREGNPSEGQDLVDINDPFVDKILKNNPALIIFTPRAK